MKINVIGGQMDRREIEEYIAYAENKYAERLISGIDIVIDGEYVDLKIHFGDINFQRTYRSADYLVKSIDKMNDAKQTEFGDKVRHKMEE